MTAIQDKIKEWTHPNDKQLVTRTIEDTTIVVAINTDGTYRVMRFFMVGDRAEVSVDLETAFVADVFLHLLQGYKL